MKFSIRVGIAVLFSAVIFACSNSGPEKGDVYYNQGDYENAISAYTEKLKYKPNDVSALYNRGRAYEESGQLDLALSDFEKALESDPNNFQILLSLSNIHYTKENYTNSLLFANRAEEIPGAPAMASFMKGRAYHSLGDTEAALKAYGNAIRLDKEYGQAYYSRGMLKVSIKRMGSACEDFQLAKGLEYPGAAEAFTKYCN
ncbi:MAG: tetratricopeptide repeat protein [Bacteroidota bacterium]|uniref:TPR repeat-containing protein n=1 Tax=Algoriphagus faecimaris TaxID=686796 RepID=A0A1G6X1N3_9BACT|nr:tetratricopeptide repeat protein [Algoriphagus faecimaris]SDD71944.1 TPR repeat-containing protein [Algoriphagus faecimaris]